MHIRTAISPVLILLTLIAPGCSSEDLRIETYQAAKERIKAQSSIPTGLDFTWTVPNDWKIMTASRMRIASFIAPPDGDGSIIILGGNAGGTLANVNRWRDQIELKPISEAALKKQTFNAKAKLGSFKWFELKNKEKNKATLATILSRKSMTIFVKLTGSMQTIKEQKSNFLQLSQSLRKK